MFPYKMGLYLHTAVYQYSVLTVCNSILFVVVFVPK